MWGDELEIFMVALYSPSPWSLLLNLKYEPHPALWYLLVWVITRITSDPMWMQVVHSGLAIGVWILIYRWSPFSTVEKILLLLSYFLFWEYFIISRNYVLIALIAFAFIALRERRRDPSSSFGCCSAYWQMCTCLVQFGRWSWRPRLRWKEFDASPCPLQEPAVYLVLLVFAIATMVPAADFAPLGMTLSSAFHASMTILVFHLAPLCRLDLGSIQDAVAFIAHPETASIPQFWNSNPTDYFVALTSCGHRSSNQTGIGVCHADRRMLADRARPAARPGIYSSVSWHCAIREHLGFSRRRPPSRRRIFGLDCIGVDGALTSFTCRLVVLGVEGASYRQRLRWRADACFRTEAIFRRIQCRCLDKAKRSCGYFSHRIT